jgi:tetratricopeptide (TPR) repeat protein
VIGPITLSEGRTAAAAKYRELRATAKDNYRWNEGDMNALGYELLGMGRMKDAIEIFKLNVETYPQSSNAYDSLGEAYANDGQKDFAIANYKKSVELNPKSESGIEALKKLEAR